MVTATDKRGRRRTGRPATRRANRQPLILLAGAPVAEPERLGGPKLFVVSGGDGLAVKVRLAAVDGTQYVARAWRTVPGCTTTLV
jgi:hypothetical protein